MMKTGSSGVSLCKDLLLLFVIRAAGRQAVEQTSSVFIEKDRGSSI